MEFLVEKEEASLPLGWDMGLIKLILCMILLLHLDLCFPLPNLCLYFPHPLICLLLPLLFPYFLLSLPLPLQGFLLPLLLEN